MDSAEIRRRVLIVSTYYKNYDRFSENYKRLDEAIEVLRESEHHQYSRKLISRIISKFEEFGTVGDRRHQNPGRPANEENRSKVVSTIEADDKLSTRELGKLTDVPQKSVHRALKNAKLKRYKSAIVQKLKPEHMSARKIFCERMISMIKADPDKLKLLWFSDEKQFHLNTPKNRKNNERWLRKREDFEIEETEAHPPQVMVWTAISTQGVIGPYFFDRNADQFSYQECIDVFFVEKLKKYDLHLKNSRFQQDGATCHYTDNTLVMPRLYFEDRIISRRSDFEWPPHSPDLNALDFFCLRLS